MEGSIQEALKDLAKKIENLQEDPAESLVLLHSRIVELQKEIEKAKLFKEGQDLYSKWIEVAEKGLNEHKALMALAFNNRGYLKYLQVDFEGAVKDYTKALIYNPELAYAYYNRGLVTYRLAFFEQAVENMEQAVSLDPSKPEFGEGLKRVREMLDSPNGHKFRLQYDTPN